MLRTILVYVHGALRHRKKGLRSLQILSKLCLVETRSHLLNRVKLIAYSPDHKLRIRSKPYERVGVNQKLAPKLFDRVDELLLGAFLFLFIKLSPFGSRAIESEVYELARKLRSWSRSFIYARSKSERTKGCAALFFFSAHGA